MPEPTIEEAIDNAINTIKNCQDIINDIRYKKELLIKIKDNIDFKNWLINELNNIE